MERVNQYYFKATVYDNDEQCECYETGFIAACTPGEAYAYCAECYGNEFVGAYIELAAEGALMLVDDGVCHDIMEDQF